MSRRPPAVPQAHRTRVAVIGAGIAGLCTAKVLRHLHFDVTVFEKEREVGGVWAACRRYPGLTTQNPRSSYEFSDFPMPRHYPEWPSGEQVQAYLESYARHFGLSDSIMLNTEVVHAGLDAGQSRWTLRVRSGPANDAEKILEFDWLVVCNGIFSQPFVPGFSGRREFRDAGGQVWHSSQFTDLEAARGRNVLVVGYGKSSCDVANATTEVSKRTVIVTRSLIWKIPKRLKNVVNFKYLFLTRMGEGLFRYIRVRGFEKFLHGPGLPLRNFLLARVEKIVAGQLRLRDLDLLPGKPLETIARSTVSLVTDGFYENVRSGRLTVHQAEIAELYPGGARLSSGERLPVDIVICGTGWRQLTPFFEPRLMDRITDERGNFRLYRSMVPVGVPRLAFNGYNSSFFSQLNAEIGALWIAACMCEKFELPGDQAMSASIDERLAWMERRTEGKHSKGTNIIPFSLHHMDELLSDLGAPLSAPKRLLQWLLPVTGSDYRRVTTGLLARWRRDREAVCRPASGGTLAGDES